MRNYTSLSVLLFVIGSTFLGVSQKALALTLSTTKPDIGQSIFVLDAVAGHFYPVFWTNLDGPHADPCAYVSGEELIQDNDLTNYGSCFNNDSGTYHVHELSGHFYSSSGDTAKSDVYLTKSNIVVSNNFLFVFSLSNEGNKSVIAGNSITNSVTATLTSGDSPNPVYFYTIGIPVGSEVIPSPEGCKPTCTSVLLITTTWPVTLVGSYPLTVSGYAKGAESKTTSFTLTVTAALDTSGVFIYLRENYY